MLVFDTHTNTYNTVYLIWWLVSVTRRNFSTLIRLVMNFAVTGLLLITSQLLIPRFVQIKNFWELNCNTRMKEKSRICIEIVHVYALKRQHIQNIWSMKYLAEILTRRE